VNAAPTRHAGKDVRMVALASAVGCTIEWYDFFLYGTVSGLIFNKLFFPTFDPRIGTLLTYTTFAVGFLARPVGGVIFGHLGDRIGRKRMLVLTLLIMGIGTFLIGCLPTYSQIGVAAPILLLVVRLVQGIGIGGEWGGAVLMAAEHSPGKRRGFYASWPQIGSPAGLALGTGTFFLLSKLGEAALLEYEVQSHVCARRRHRGGDRDRSFRSVFRPAFRPLWTAARLRVGNGCFWCPRLSGVRVDIARHSVGVDRDHHPVRYYLRGALRARGSAVLRTLRAIRSL
jgi:MFS family permease